MNHRTLVIPCGGSGTRLSAYPFPKCLLPVAQRPILFQIMQAWRPAIDRVVLVLNPQNETLVRRYVKTYWQDSLPVDFALQARPTGTFFAVQEALKLVRTPWVVLNWCDLYPTAIPDGQRLSEGNLAFTSDRADHCRWEFQDGVFRPRGGGNPLGQGLLGIFVLNRPDSAYRPDSRPNPAGETEILEAFDPRQFTPLTWEHFVDIGDPSRYGPAVRATGEAGVRAFGSGATLEWLPDRIVKRHVDKGRAAAEAGWYAEAALDFVPRVLAADPLTLERLPAEPCGRRLDRRPTPAAEARVVRGIFDLAEQIHRSRPSRPARRDDGRVHYLGKTRDRLQRVRFLLEPLARRSETSTAARPRARSTCWTGSSRPSTPFSPTASTSSTATCSCPTPWSMAAGGTSPSIPRLVRSRWALRRRPVRLRQDLLRILRPLRPLQRRRQRVPPVARRGIAARPAPAPGRRPAAAGALRRPAAGRPVPGPVHAGGRCRPRADLAVGRRLHRQRRAQRRLRLLPGDAAPARRPGRR